MSKTKTLKKKFFVNPSELIEKEIDGEIWKFRRMAGGEYEKLLYESTTIDGTTIKPNGLKLIDEQRKACIVEVPDVVKKNYEEVFGEPFKLTLENLKKLDIKTYDAIGKICMEINGASEEEKNTSSPQ